MMKTFFLTAAATALAGLSLYAYTEVTETMTVELNDGTSQVFNVADLNKVSFNTTEKVIALNVTTPTGENDFQSATLSSMFRYSPADNDQQVQFFFGTETDAADFASLANGSYMFRINCPLSALYQGEVSLTDSSVELLAYQYTEGEITATLDEVTEGTLSTARNTKGVVTLELNAAFADGTTVRASYQGTPTDIDSIEDLFPSGNAELPNELKYYGYDGDVQVTSAISGVSLAPATGGPFKSAGWNRLKFTLDNSSAKECYIDIDPNAAWGVFDFNASNTASVYFCYGGIQVANGANSNYASVGTKGSVELINNGDGTITVKADVTNSYNYSWGSAGGTPERVTITYTGACEGLAPQVANEFCYYNMDGEAAVSGAVTGVTKSTSTSSLSKGWNRYTLSFDNASAQQCYIDIDPTLIGQELDYSALESASVVFKYGSIQVMGPNNMYANQGVKGTVKVEDNGDGTVTIQADVTNTYKSLWGEGTSGTPERVTISYSGALN